MEFSPDAEMQRIPDLAQEFFNHVLFDEEPIFVADEATIGDVSLVSREELMKRCSILWNVSLRGRLKAASMEIDSRAKLEA